MGGLFITVRYGISYCQLRAIGKLSLNKSSLECWASYYTWGKPAILRALLIAYTFVTSLLCTWRLIKKCTYQKVRKWTGKFLCTVRYVTQCGKFSRKIMYVTQCVKQQCTSFIHVKNVTQQRTIQHMNKRSLMNVLQWYITRGPSCKRTTTVHRDLCYK